MFWPLAIQPILINVYKYTIQRRLRLNKNTCKYQMPFFAHSHNIHKQMTKFLSNVTKSASLLVAWGMMATWLFVSLLNMILRRISAWNTLRIWFGAHISLKSYGVALSEMSNRLLHRMKYRKKKTLRLCTKKTKWSLLEVCCCVCVCLTPEHSVCDRVRMAKIIFITVIDAFAHLLVLNTFCAGYIQLQLSAIYPA